MSATDELRRMLDDRGEDYISDQHSVTWAYYTDPHTATESMDGTLIVTGLTPEQAIAATLGSEREKQLELLVNQLWYLVNHRSGYGYAAALEAIEELGIEVDE